ncbi:protein kinase c [Vairimorpha apis BRL 01]|uniref:non-specific serine/threonine protein kinase n=1 Tax=Vairimorpha apis BRL 01 TaxID=1037528 RepID=T0L840_9MICR|nr:protein kinase c [Vairimorpha apis BRL 01]
MKRVAKEDILKQPFTSLFMAEKKLLTESVNSEWLVSAKMTLQDNEYLYYLMDYIPGGDFMGLLSKEDTLEEKWVKFYTVEIICALDELHKLGWIHRDLKPDNILIGKDGHIKLADFGSSIKMENKKAKSTFVVGTPDYISPDILESSNVENEYSENVDFWTLGVIIYEMLFGVTPFYSNSLVETYRKIVDLEYNFPFNISEKIKDLIQKLIQKKDKRLNIYEIKKHPFFEGVDWENIKSMVPPYIPEILDEFDTSNFYDTAFEMKTRIFISTPNFIDFVGFSHDPMLEKAVRKLFLNEKEIKNENVPIIKENDEVKNNKKLLNEIQAQILETNQKLQDKQNEYKEIIINILSEKDDLDSIENELKIKKNSYKIF